MVAFGTKQSLTEYLDGIIAGYGQRYGQVLWDNDITDSEVCELPFNSLCWSIDCLQHLIVHKAPMQESTPVQVHQPFCLCQVACRSLFKSPRPLPPPPPGTIHMQELANSSVEVLQGLGVANGAHASNIRAKSAGDSS